MTHTDILVSLTDVFAQADHLPTLPTVAVEILRLTRDDTASLEDLTAVLALDPALTAKILKLANSAAFCRGAEVTSLERATLLLGMHAVQLLALSFSLTQSLSRPHPSGAFDYLEYWQRSATMAVASRELARLVKHPAQHEAFLCGLLSGIGQLVLAQTLPERYGEVLAQTGGARPTTELERQVLGVDRRQVGAALLRGWEFPSLLTDTIRDWEAPETWPSQAEAATRSLCHLLHLANATRQVIWGAEKEQALRTLHEAGRTHFGVAAVELDNYFISLETHLAETATLLDVEMAGFEDFTTLLAAARDQMVHVSLETVLDLQHAATHAQELEKEKQHLWTLAQTDKLTGLLNRAGFESALQQIVAARVQGNSDRALGLLLMDIDHFKAFNDTYGHLLGDQVLQQVAGWIAESTRQTDVEARYGGEEFVVVVPDTTLEGLEQVAERIRARIGAGQVMHQGKPLQVTLSVGGACVHQVRTVADGRALLDHADHCLYEAKGAGRNCVICRELPTCQGDG